MQQTDAVPEEYAGWPIFLSASLPPILRHSKTCPYPIFCARINKRLVHRVSQLGKTHGERDLQATRCFQCFAGFCYPTLGSCSSKNKSAEPLPEQVVLLPLFLRQSHVQCSQCYSKSPNWRVGSEKRLCL